MKRNEQLIRTFFIQKRKLEEKVYSNEPLTKQPESAQINNETMYPQGLETHKEVKEPKLYTTRNSIKHCRN